MRRPLLVASDLDRTLIYSRAASALGGEQPSLVCVEVYQGEEASFMTAEAAGLLTRLAAASVFVPVTTRTRAQLERVRLPCPAPYAVAANGGCLYVDGTLDPAWTQQVVAALRQVAPLDEVWAHVSAACDPRWTTALRQAEEMFCYAVVDRTMLPAGFLEDVTAWTAARGWTTSLQGRKLYWVPRTLTKSAAVREIARRVDAAGLLAAGDSLLDIDLLMAADLGIHPAHGEIAEGGWSAPHVRRAASAGVRAGEDICRWLLEQVLSADV